MIEQESLLSPRERMVWRAVQTLLWVIGVTIVALLLFRPDVGIHVFWNGLIPVAPALIALAPGLWRNICPLGSTALLPRYAGLSRRRHVPQAWQGRLLLIGVVLLFLIVPLRHVVLDTNGPATAGVLVALALIAAALGSQFEWKSGWCSGVCPVHTIERLYGSVAVVSPKNAHCTECERCVQPCADSTPGL